MAGPMVRLLCATLLCVLAVACGPLVAKPAFVDGATPASSPFASSTPATLLPGPHRPVPTSPRPLARELIRTTVAVRRSIQAWVAPGGTRTLRPPRAVALQALYQQRLYRALASAPRLARRTLALLPGWLAGEARNDVRAGTDLLSLARSSHYPRVRIRTQRPEPASQLLRYYRQAQRRFGVSWAVLASVNFIESKFGRVRSRSGAGAQGPMQFIPSTWAVYGMGGNVHDPHDAIMGAANYLHASGAPPYYRRALYHYNPALPYVDAVLRYAKQMARQPEGYFEYYNWQVFRVTPSGDRQLTGPGT